MKRFKKLIIGFIVFFVLFTLVGFFILPPILKSVLVKKLSESLRREVAISQIKVNPYTLSLTIRGFKVKDRQEAETFLSFDELFVNLQSFSALRFALILKEVRLTNPFIRISRGADLSYNFSDLLEKKTETPPATPPAEKGKPFRFSLNNIQLINGSIDFWDGPKQTKHTVRDLNIGVPFISSIPSQIDIFVQPTFSAKINETAYRLQGNTKPFRDTLETVFDIHIQDLDLPYYLAYSPVKLNVKLASAFLDVRAKVSFLQPRDKGSSLTVTGDVALKKVALDDNKKNPLFRLPLLEIAIAPTEPLKQVIHLSKISIQSPELEVRRNEKGSLNLQALFPEKSGTKPAPGKSEDSTPLALDIDEILLAGGKVSFSDLSGKTPFKTILNPIDLKVDHFSNGKDKKSAYVLSLKTEAKESVRLEGEFSMDPLGAGGSLEIKSVPLKKYAPYYRDNILFDIEDGRLDVSTRYRYAKGQKEPEVLLSAVSLILSSLRLKKAEDHGDFLKIPTFSIRETEVDLTKKELRIGTISTQKGELLATRFKNGDLSLLKLVPPPSVPQEPLKENQGKGTEQPWMVSLRQLSVDDYSVRVEDQTPADPALIALDKLTLKGENISTAKNSKGKLSLSLLLNSKGTLSTTGTVSVDPVAADLKMDLKGVEVGAFQPYFTDQVRIILTGGAFSTSGTLSLGMSDNKAFKTSYRGEASLSNFASVDKQHAQDFLKWESLAFSDLDVGVNPLLVDIKGISLTNFYSRLSIHPDGTLNVQQVMVKEEPKKEAASSAAQEKAGSPAREKPSPAPKEKEPSKNIKIGTITLQGGKVDFSDRSLKPDYSVRLTEIGGRISGLSSEETTLADLELRAKLDDFAPLEITGKINPLKEDLYVDLKVRFKDMELSPLTPYSGKYVGYTIEKGKLSFDLSYLIDKRKLDSQNRIFLDQFNLGEKVESPGATKLPVKLAIALLKDRKGEIKLDIPVTGSLDDPKFSVWGIILKVLVNLIAKAATSPFSLLGAIIGGGEELSAVEFEYGSSAIAEPSLKKLDAIAKALHDRPSLKIDIEGHADMERDREGLKQVLFHRKLKAQKLNQMVKRGQPPVSVDEVNVEKQEYDQYLKMAYKEEKFPKPRNILGIAKDIPVPEMEKLILTHIEVRESDLRTLASQRAMKVKETILKSGQVEPERIFILEPKSLAPEKKEKLKESRVDLKLK
jgi:uncharacterized protein involved in outer membrane biogenesis